MKDPPELPVDPVRARLLPDGVLDDPAAAAEFRRFAQTTLLERKRADAAALRPRCGPTPGGGRGRRQVAAGASTTCG